MAYQIPRCPACGAEVNRDDSGDECRYCGAPLERQSATVPGANTGRSSDSRKDMFRHKQTTGSSTRKPPLAFALMWLVVTTVVAWRVWSDDHSTMAIVPLAMGLFGFAHMMRRRRRN
ncbi:hypothetical protein OAS86_01530 [Gammaproteobacteria bacterium]|nr:hypothetical protein [Gammaproteobacteria bacterium]